MDRQAERIGAGHPQGALRLTARGRIVFVLLGVLIALGALWFGQAVAEACERPPEVQVTEVGGG